MTLSGVKQDFFGLFWVPQNWSKFEKWWLLGGKEISSMGTEGISGPETEKSRSSFHVEMVKDLAGRYPWRVGKLGKIKA